MMHAYDEMYLEKARIALGRMFDFVVYQLGYSIEKFFDLFISSGVSRRFENGDVDLLVGKSGVEIGYEVLDKTFGDVQPIEIEFTANRSEEYWTGWVLAYYQWMHGISFSKINEKVSIRDILALYTPYHEMDILQFVDRMNELRQAKRCMTYLKMFRQQMNMTQRELAEKTQIPIKTIQQYAQGQKNINKAQSEYVIRLAKVLCCAPEQLLEF